VDCRELDAEAPDLAGLALAEFARSEMALVGTLRKDGSTALLSQPDRTRTLTNRSCACRADQ
jgi:hypothetical protein